jgi:hypothetical protein
MTWNENGHRHQMMYLASGIAIGALGASLVLNDNSARRRLTDAIGIAHPQPHKSIFWPWGALIAGGAVAAGLATVAPDLARYIKIEMM